MKPTDLIGRPYALPSEPPSSFDCYSLVEFVRRECFGLPTPIPYAVESLVSPNDVGRVWLTVEHMDVWQPVKEPVDGDIVKLERAHVGVYCCGAVLHAWRASGRGSVVLTNRRVIDRLFSMCQFMRLAQ